VGYDVIDSRRPLNVVKRVVHTLSPKQKPPAARLCVVLRLPIGERARVHRLEAILCCGIAPEHRKTTSTVRATTHITEPLVRDLRIV